MDDEKLPDEFLCPISQMVMTDPVIADDGHTYERSFILEWLRPGRMRSPITNLMLPSRTVRPNIALRSTISSWRAEAATRAAEQVELRDIQFAVQLREEEVRKEGGKLRQENLCLKQEVQRLKCTVAELAETKACRPRWPSWSSETNA